MTPEGIIKKDICSYLRAIGVFHWVNQAGKVPGRTLAKKGVADLLGVYKGKLLAIEVKTEKGIVSEEQREFITAILLNGGIAFVARSVDDVKKNLEAA